MKIKVDITSKCLLFTAGYQGAGAWLIFRAKTTRAIVNNQLAWPSRHGETLAIWTMLFVVDVIGCDLMPSLFVLIKFLRDLMKILRDISASRNIRLSTFPKLIKRVARGNSDNSETFVAFNSWSQKAETLFDFSGRRQRELVTLSVPKSRDYTNFILDLWRLIVVSCFLLGDPSTQSSPTNVGDDSRLLPVSVSQEWPLETMLKVTAKKELREFVMNFLLDERMCSSKALFEVVVGEDSTDLAGYQWWSRQCGSKKDFALLGFPDFTDITWARERRDANKGGAKRYYGLSSKEWRKLEKLIKKMCCKAVKTMVELPTEGDSRVQLKPSCVAVRRCSGCCDSRLFECRPTEISVKTVIALGVRKNARKVRVDDTKPASVRAE
ncbi:LOW QUALITY PROTEIN: uncharacterized protein LOC119591770 [Penaeus monodon]|uniref:LOW QUALITY PROTEIN: uncharacterized protein LOC119591770 n=1 Tax=Penaeus monodon TaxID=6687 RepID=UPI0018A747EF|nr:LOW QUALITY PROTEIN: uncharacterized protein LOC119591770 [Penaeus monodon]